jgi:hypothetical protein
LVTLTSQPISPDPPPSLSNRLANWDYFKHPLNQRLLLQIPLKTTDDTEEAVKFFTDTVQWAGWKANPPLPDRTGINACPLKIQQQLAAKRKLRRNWQHFRTPENKKLLNAATQDLKQLIRTLKNDQVQTFLQELTPTAATDYSLWKATKNLKRVTYYSPSLRTHLGTWTNSNFDKAHAFAQHLSGIFQPHPSENLPADDEAIMQLLEASYQLEPPVPRFRCTDIQTIINSLHSKKSPGYDLITVLILKSLPPIGIKYLTQLFNSALFLGYFPAQWKVAQIILLLKPGKPPHELTSYRPISLLPAVFKVFEKLL